MSRALSWSLVNGWLPVVLTIAGCVAFALLVVGRGRRWWRRGAPLALAAGIGATFGLRLFVEYWWRPFPDSLPATVWLWVGAGMCAIAFVLVRPWSSWRWRIAGCGAMALVVLTSAVQVNWFFGQYPTVRAAFGLPPAGQRGLPKPGQQQPGATHGVVSQVNIPAPVSHFPARPGWVYVPPAYLSSPRPKLPVLVLLAGQPGSPRDWLDGGKLADVLDRFAAGRGGRAPVVVIPDDLGSLLANPLCLDSKLGNARTYLTVDVPRWITENLQIDRDPSRWAIGGYSHGGTCSLQMAVTAPQVYPTFIDISGQDEPTLGDHAETVRQAFGGDEKAFASANPLDILAKRSFAGTAAMVVAGTGDPTYRRQQLRVFAACRAAGVDVTWLDLPGGHTWQVWGEGLRRSLPWLGERTRLAA